VCVRAPPDGGCLSRPGQHVQADLGIHDLRDHPVGRAGSRSPAARSRLSRWRGGGGDLAALQPAPHPVGAHPQGRPTPSGVLEHAREVLRLSLSTTWRRDEVVLGSLRSRWSASAVRSHRNPVFRRTLAQIAGSLWDICRRSLQIFLGLIAFLKESSHHRTFLFIDSKNRNFLSGTSPEHDRGKYRGCGKGLLGALSKRTCL